MNLHQARFYRKQVNRLDAQASLLMDRAATLRKQANELDPQDEKEKPVENNA